MLMPSGTGDSYGGGGGLEIDTTILATYDIVDLDLDLDVNLDFGKVKVKEIESDLSVQYASQVSAGSPLPSPHRSASGYGSGYDTDFEDVSSKYPELEGLYLLHNTIGRGGFSKVKVATDLFTGNKVAIKIVDKEHVGSELPRIDLEVETLQPLNHTHICKLFSVIWAKTKIFMIMEYCPTDLYEHIVTHDDVLPLDEARRIFIQLVSAVTYLHSNGIVHRDLKPENVLLDRNMDAKLTDFGLCAVPGKNRINKPTLKTLCGSPAYCAPELLRGPPYVGSKVDVWSLGVMLYVLLAKELPFYSKNVKELYQKIKEGHYRIPDQISDLAKDLIDQMLQPNVSLRPSLHRLWSHPWIQAGDLGPFKEQMADSLHHVEMESRILSRYSFLPLPNVGRIFASTENFNLQRNVPDKPVFSHNFIVPYIETSGGDATTLMTYGKCGSRKSTGPSATRKSLVKTDLRVFENRAPNEQPQLPPKRKLFGWISQAFRKTKGFLTNCQSPFGCRCRCRWGRREDVGIGGLVEEPYPNFVSDSMHLIPVAENNGNLGKMMETGLTAAMPLPPPPPFEEIRSNPNVDINVNVKLDLHTATATTTGIGSGEDGLKLEKVKW